MMNDYKIKKVCPYLIAFLLIIGNYLANAQSKAKANQWVDSVFATLDEEKKIAQLMMVPAYSAGNEDHYEALYKLVEEHGVGGIIFMQGGPVAQVKLINNLQKKSTIPLLLAMDAEWGPGMQLDSTLSYPMAMSLGALRDDSLIFNTALHIGKQLKKLGIHMNFSPVADINTNPQNPVIGMRSFSDDPEIVTQKARLYSHGLDSAGIIPVIKHFPGHGDTEVDPHLELPVLKATGDLLLKRELYPFKKLANENIPAILVGHLYAPNIINDGLPASLSPKIIKEVLRKNWNYDGLIISDFLNNPTISENFKRGQAEEFALKAGNDILLAPDNISASIRRIKRALKKGDIQEAQLDVSVKRILKAKYNAGLSTLPTVDTANLIASLNSPESHVLKRNLSAKSITLVNNEDNIIPIQRLEDKTFASFNIGDEGITLYEYLSKYTLFNIYSEDKNNLEEIFKKLSLYDAVVVGVFSSNLQEQMIRQLKMLRSQTEVILVVFGSPYTMTYFSEFKNIIWAPDQSQLSQELVPQLIFGAEEFDGQLPVAVNKFDRGRGQTTTTLNRLAFSIPEEVGIDANHLKRIDEIVENSILNESTPGCQVLIARHGKVIWEKSYGYHSYDSILPVDNFTIYDLASITKVAASVQVLMFLQERGLIDLDKKISVYLPDLEGSNKENMTLRDILTHQAGLWPYLPFYKSTMAGASHLPEFYRNIPEAGYLNQVGNALYTGESVKDSVWQWVKQSKLRDKKPREPYDYKYSDMGYYIIQRLVEKLTNQPLDEFLNQNLYDPMGLITLGYQPLCNFPITRIAPTEEDDYFRFGLVSGFVHDQGAALIGGVAGHAGLFSNSLDLAKLMQLMLQKGHYGGRQYFKEETITKFTEQQYVSNRRGLGWDKPVMDEIGGPTSEYSSGATFGHTGFTGTAAWVDPEFDLVYIFLSNRIHPNAMNTKLISTNVRTRIQDIIYQAMFKEIQYEEIIIR